MTDELSRDGYAYRLATVTTDVHTADCADCARAGVAGATT